jgi:hypothetical protein
MALHFVVTAENLELLIKRKVHLGDVENNIKTDIRVVN